MDTFPTYPPEFRENIRAHRHAEATRKLQELEQEKWAEYGLAGPFLRSVVWWLIIGAGLGALFAPLALIAVPFLLLYGIAGSTITVHNITRPWRRLKLRMAIHRSRQCATP